MDIEQKQAELIEHFVKQASNHKGSSLSTVIVEATSHSSLFAFSEILAVPNVSELAGSVNSLYLDVLRLFAYGTWSDYKSNAGRLPQLVPDQVLKLKQLTVLTLAETSKVLPYDQLMQELDVTNVRELEDFLINDCMYAGIVRGKLDQLRRCFEVQFAAGRDLRPGQLGNMIDTLSSCSVTGAVGPELGGPDVAGDYSSLDEFLGVATPSSPYSDSPAADPIPPEGHSVWRGTVVHDDSVAYLEKIYERHGDIFQDFLPLGDAYRTMVAEDVVSIAQILEQYTLETLPRSVRRNLFALVRNCRLLRVEMGWVKATYNLVRFADAIPTLKAQLTQIEKEHIQTRAHLDQVQAAMVRVNESIQQHERVIAGAGPSRLLSEGLF